MSIFAHRNVFADQPSPAFLIQDPIAEHILEFDFSTQTFNNIVPPFAKTAENIGTGVGLFESKDPTTDSLKFKTLKPGAFTSITYDGDSVTIATDVSQSAVTSANLGTGQGIFANKSGNLINLKSLKAIDTNGHLTISSDADHIIYTSVAEVNTAGNLGTTADGKEIFKSKTGEELQFRRVKGSSNISITENTNDLTVAVDLGWSSTGAGELVRSLADGTYDSLGLGSLVTYPAGDHKKGLRSNGTDIEWSTGSVATWYQFKVTFEADGSVENILDLPSGWSFTRTGNRINITHTEGTMIKGLYYMGYDAQTTKYSMGFTNQAFNLTVTNATKTTEFEFITNSSVAGADVNSHALINVGF